MKDKRFSSVLILVLLFAAGLALRISFLPANTVDMKVFNLKWYDYLVEHGRFRALGDEFANYAPPYLYLLSLATLTQGWLPKLTAIKAIPILFDALNAYLVYRIVKTQSGDGDKPAWAAALFWVLPTVLLNGAFWGQADSVYTCFLLLSVFFLLQEKWAAGVAAFSVSFAIKAQAMFFFPLLALLFFKKQIRWIYFLLVPLIYAALMIPAWLAGRSALSLASVYLNQAGTFRELSKNAPNLYIFAPQNAYQPLLLGGLILALALPLLWAWSYGTKRGNLSPSALILAALISLALAPFLLPKMHDRYFYPADVFSLLAAFFLPQLWFVPVLYQIISTLAYLPFLFAANPHVVLPPAALLNLCVVVFLLWKQWQLSPPNEPA